MCPTVPDPDLEMGGGAVSKKFFGWSKNKVVGGGPGPPRPLSLDLPLSYGDISELTQQDGRGKKTTNLV